jgi:hypothetical protein
MFFITKTIVIELKVHIVVTDVAAQRIVALV